MAKKPTLLTVGSGYTSTDTINTNFTRLTNAFNNTLSRDGSTPNQMAADLDMNSKDILNIGNLDVTGTLTVNGADFNDLVDGIGSGDTFQIVNRYNGNGVTTAFTLTTAPLARANTNIFINGVYQQKNTYEVSGTTITFGTAPPVGTANIEVITTTGAEGATIDASMVDSSEGNLESVVQKYEAVYDRRLSAAWTPVIADAESGGNEAVVTTAYGRIRASDTIVRIGFAITGIDTTGLTGSNELWIRGLPLTSRNSNGSIATAPVRVSGVTFTNTPFAYMVSNDTGFRLMENNSGTGPSFLTVSDFATSPSTSSIYGSLVFEADD